MNYQITNNWTALSVLTGIAIGSPLVLSNAGRAGDIIEAIVSDTEPLDTDRGVPIKQLDNQYTISGQSQEVWVRYIRYDLTGTITPTRTCLLSVQDSAFIQESDALPSDLVTSNAFGSRRLRVSSEESQIEFTLLDQVHSFTGSYLIASGQDMALNMSFASDVVISKVLTNEGLSLLINDDHATGTADGIFAARNLNTLSDDLSPSTSQIYYDATAVGNTLSFGNASLEPFVITGEGKNTSIIVNNSSGADKVITISALFKEIGSRNPAFGLYPHTQLEASTEMSIYG